MTRKEITISLKEIQDISCNLRLKKKVITLEEFEKLTDKLYNKITKLKNEIEKE